MNEVNEHVSHKDTTLSYFWSDSEVSQKHPYESRDPKDERRRES